MLRKLALALTMSLAAAPIATAQMASLADKTRTLERIDGFVPMYWDAVAGKLWLEVRRLGQEILYISSLPAGVGSNDIGLDRGQLSGERIVKFERVGPRCSWSSRTTVSGR